MLFPRKHVSRIVHEEFLTAIGYWNRLQVICAFPQDRVPKPQTVTTRKGKQLLVARIQQLPVFLPSQACTDWRGVARKNGIPDEYFPLVEFPRFSIRSEPKWWKFLWPLIQKRIDVSKLQPLAQHDASGRGVTKRKRYASD